MKITSIKIEKLFDLFDYDISFENEENLLMITGPNGFGKTMILNIIFNLFNNNLVFFQKLVFRAITIYLNDGTSIVITKKIELSREVSKIEFVILKNENKFHEFNYNVEFKEIETIIQKELPALTKLLDNNKWLDHYANKFYTFENLISMYYEILSNDEIINISLSMSNQVIDLIKVHLIKEQRLFKKVRNYGQNQEEQNQSIMIETIQTYTKEFKKFFTDILFRSYRFSQELDSSYPNRLITEKGTLTKEEYNIRFEKLKEKQDRLKRNGLYDSKQEVLAYSENDYKALLVYLNDLEKKLSVFDNLLEKLDLFSTILNKRRFTFKSIQIDRDRGFYFKTSQGKELELNQLSSGEQHEIILLYELIFNAKEDTLVLIDEPELSLHVSWQKEFINDILKIGELQNIQVIVATHSPAIINGRWDLVYNLQKLDTQ